MLAPLRRIKLVARQLPRPELASDVAHDLRSLVTIVKGYTELMESEGAHADHCTRILRACRRMCELVDVSLDPHRKAAAIDDLAAVLETCVEDHRRHAEQKQMKLALEIEVGLPRIATDHTALSRILDNLIGNAVKYSPAGTRVTATARAADGGVVFGIHDEGPGIPADELPLVFDPFRTGSAIATGGERSYGLGLSIVKRLVAQLGGRITVHSRVGQGTTFSLWLPAGPSDRSRSAH